MRRLFVLRPEPGAGETVERARAIGLDAVHVPLFAIEPVEWQLPDASSFDALLLTSANGVRQAGNGLHEVRQLPVHAVGAATATAAREAGLIVSITGGGNIDDLLAQVPTSTRLLHLCGEHWREPKPSAHDIVRVPVYRAREIPPPPQLGGIAGQVAIVHSPRAARRLAELVPAEMRASVRIAAISHAAADAAGDGWERAEHAPHPDDAQLLALAAMLCQNGADDHGFDPTRP